MNKMFFNEKAFEIFIHKIKLINKIKLFFNKVLTARL